MKHKSTLGIRVETLRKIYRLSQSAFGNKIGISYVAVANIENGKTSKPHPDTLKSIVKMFGTTYDWLEYEKGEMLPNGTIVKPVDMSNSIYQDALYLELKEQAQIWQARYNDAFNMLNKVIDSSLGKLRAVDLSGFRKSNRSRVHK